MISKPGIRLVDVTCVCVCLSVCEHTCACAGTCACMHMNVNRTAGFEKSEKMSVKCYGCQYSE